MIDRRPLLDARRVPVLAFAPRLDPRLHAVLACVDDPDRPIAEAYRRLAREARAMHLFRPSYEHVRRLIHALRRLRSRRRSRRASTAQVLFEVAYNVRPPTALLDHALETDPRPP